MAEDENFYKILTTPGKYLENKNYLMIELFKDIENEALLDIIEKDNYLIIKLYQDFQWLIVKSQDLLDILLKMELCQISKYSLLYMTRNLILVYISAKKNES